MPTALWTCLSSHALVPLSRQVRQEKLSFMKNAKSDKPVGMAVQLVEKVYDKLKKSCCLSSYES